MCSNELIIALSGYVAEVGWEKGLQNFYLSDTFDSSLKSNRDFSICIEKSPLWKLFLPEKFDFDLLLFDFSLGRLAIDLAQSYKRVVIWESSFEQGLIIRKRIEEVKVSNIVIINQETDISLFDLSIGTIVSPKISNFEVPGRFDISKQLLAYDFLLVSEAIMKNHSVVEVMDKKALSTGGFLSRFYRSNSKSGLCNALEASFSAEYVYKKIFQCSGSLTKVKKIYLKEQYKNRDAFNDLFSKKQIKSRIKKTYFLCPVEIHISDASVRTKTWADYFLIHLTHIKGFSDAVNVKECFSGNPNMGLIRVNDNGKDFIFRLPMGAEENSSRADKNYAMLKILSTLPRIKNLAPLPVAEGEYNGQRYYGESFLMGSLESLKKNNLEDYWPQIFDLQAFFGKDLGKTIILDENAFSVLIGNDIENIRANLFSKYDYDLLDCVQLFLQENLLGEKQKLVLMHGDFKIENMLFGHRNQLKGVFDWDLGERYGFPLIDLYYFFGFSFFHKEEYPNSGIIDYITGELIEGRLEPYISKKIDSYSTCLNLSNSYRSISKILFWIHYISKITNIAFSWKDKFLFKRNFREPLELIAKKYF